MADPIPPEEETDEAEDEAEDTKIASRNKVTEDLPDDIAQEIEALQSSAPESAQLSGPEGAGLRPRLAAGLVDLGLLFYFYWAALFAYRYFVWEDPFGGIPIRFPHNTIFHAIFGLFVFLYFFVFESVFFTTFGKLCAGLSVRGSDGGVVRLFSVFLRTLFRPIDCVLFPVFGWILLEKTTRHRRLGDLVAGTLVIQRHRWMGKRISVDRPGSATLRGLAGLIDGIFFAGFLGSLFLFFDPQRPFFCFLVFLAIPALALAWHLLWETLAQTTAGKWIFGLRLCQEDGRPVFFAGAFWRTVFRLFDTNPFGWLALFLSQHKQRPGDLAATTRVVHAKRGWPGLIALAASLAVIGTLWFFGQSNPRNFLSPFFRIDPIRQSLFVPFSVATAKPAARGLTIGNFLFLNEDHSLKTSNEYAAGSTALITFELSGFTTRDNVAWVQEDLTVRYPDGSIGLKLENIIDFHKEVQTPGAPLELSNTLALPANTLPGRYALVLSIRDRLSGMQLTEQKFFQITTP